MRQQRRLKKVARSARKRLQRLRRIVKAIDRSDTHVTDRSLAFATIEVQTLWANFLRSYYLACALNARRGRRSTIRTSKPYASANDAMGAAILRFKPNAKPLSTGQWHRRDEPAWHDKSTLITLAQEANWSNEETINAALSIKGARGALDLPVFRNFYAHRSGANLIAVTALGPSYGIPQYRRPSDILLSLPSNGHEPLLVEWIDEFDIIIEWMCE